MFWRSEGAACTASLLVGQSLAETFCFSRDLDTRQSTSSYEYSQVFLRILQSVLPPVFKHWGCQSRCFPFLFTSSSHLPASFGRYHRTVCSTPVCNLCLGPSCAAQVSSGISGVSLMAKVRLMGCRGRPAYCLCLFDHSCRAGSLSLHASDAPSRRLSICF